MENNEFADTLNDKEILPKKNSKTKILVIIFSLIALIIITGIILLIIFGSKTKDKEKDKENNKYLGEIICVYNIEKENIKQTIFGEKYKK